MKRYPYELIQLTDREYEVLRLVALGLSAKEAALELDIAPCTVERHVENVRLKTRTRTSAFRSAMLVRCVQCGHRQLVQVSLLTFIHMH